MSMKWETTASIAAENERLRKAWQEAWAERNEARDRITAALALHTRGSEICYGCGDEWPCPTARALGVTE